MRNPRIPVPCPGGPAAIVVALLAAAPAWAGGVGVFVHGGAHAEKVFFYSDHSIEGAELTNTDDYPQFSENQAVLQGGSGLEFLLGDRDDKIQGVFRVYYNVDAPQSEPGPPTGADDPTIEQEWIISAHRDKARHVGMASMGLSWGIVGNPNKFQAGVSAHLGSGFLTNDHSEFFNIQLGPMITYRLNRQLTGFADLHATARFRKEFGFGGQAMVGMRYMFD